MNMSRPPCRFIEGLARAFLWLAAVALTAMMGVTVADVALRYAFNHPISGSYDLVESALIAVVFFGLPGVFASQRHIVIDVVDMLLPRFATRFLSPMGEVLSVVALAILAWAMAKPAQQAFDYGDRKLELGLPLYLLWLMALIGVVSAALSVLVRLLFASRKGDTP